MFTGYPHKRGKDGSVEPIMGSADLPSGGCLKIVIPPLVLILAIAVNTSTRVRSVIIDTLFPDEKSSISYGTPN